MTLFVDGESETAFVGRLAPSWRGLVNRVFEPVSTCYARHRQRRDLLDYLARDYRAAAAPEHLEPAAMKKPKSKKGKEPDDQASLF